MGDLLIYETGVGGDTALKHELIAGDPTINDFQLTDGIFNMIYIALFGGNPGESTTGFEEDGQQRFDWWGNQLLFPNLPDIQFNSFTENILNTISLTSQNREIIKGFVKKDLQFLTNLAKVSVEVLLLDVDRIEIDIKVNELSNLQNSEFQFIWDGTKKEVIEIRTI